MKRTLRLNVRDLEKEGQFRTNPKDSNPKDGAVLTIWPALRTEANVRPSYSMTCPATLWTEAADCQVRAHIGRQIFGHPPDRSC